ncbi:hypothetical protein [Erysipelothrix anatis]|uniref:hypothetical protein n=1 Tax=Erysipelothrix anatis TaxID=2683713 RepID=UPI00135BCF49|nr:hypothetical protein [Erysipelothrix anatis]
MKKSFIKLTAFFLLLSLSACNQSNETMRFNQWNLLKPTSELLYSYSDKERGIHGDGVDCYVYRLSPDYKEYVTDFLKDSDISITNSKSILSFPSDISEEIFKIKNTEIIEYLNTLDNLYLALVPNKNDKLLIIVDESNERISFIFSFY